jgi:hypothetical protein
MHSVYAGANVVGRYVVVLVSQNAGDLLNGMGRQYVSAVGQPLSRRSTVGAVW